MLSNGIFMQIREVSLITRPRRFGKTLNMSMLECFFSAKYTSIPYNDFVKAMLDDDVESMNDFMECLIR